MIKYSSTRAPRHQGGTWEPIGEKYHGGNAMEEIRRPLAAHGLQPGRKSGIWPWEFNTRPGRLCRALATSIFTRVGATRTPQCCPGFGRLCPISGGLCARESRSLGVVHTDDLVDPADEGGDLDVHPWHVFSTTPESPGDKTCELMVAGILAD